MYDGGGFCSVSDLSRGRRLKPQARRCLVDIWTNRRSAGRSKRAEGARDFSPGRSPGFRVSRMSRSEGPVKLSRQASSCRDRGVCSTLSARDAFFLLPRATPWAKISRTFRLRRGYGGQVGAKNALSQYCVHAHEQPSNGAATAHPTLFALVTLVLVCFSGPLIAQQDSESVTGRQLMFAPPPLEGVISLGVYDAKGKLVRVLAKAAAVDGFKAGLNGLIIDWDGNTGSGKPAPGGRYFARGVLIGDVALSGIAFHLNDWADNAITTRVKSIMNGCLLTGGDLAILGDAGTPQVLIVNPNQSDSRVLPTRLPATRVKSSGTDLLLFNSEQLALIEPATGNVIWQKQLQAVRDADVYGDRIVAIEGNGIWFETASVPRQVTPPDGELMRCAVLDSSLVVAAKNGTLWKLTDDHFDPVDIGQTAELLDLSAGKGDTVWLLLKSGSNTLLQQVDLTGKQVREIVLPPDLQNAKQVASARDEDSLLVIVELERGQRVVGLRFQNTNAQHSIWEKWLDRSLVPFNYFDLKDGQVMPSDTKTDSAPVFVKPANNPMENTRQQAFQLTVFWDDSGTWVANSDGLPLFQVSKTKNVKQVQWSSDGANGLRVYVSDGAAVEEYRITRLESLYRFDAGSFD
jgi:hypothetical protein